MTTLVLTDRAAAVLRGMGGQERETAAVALCGVAAGDSAPRLLVDEVVPVPDGAYVDRKADALTVSSGGYVPALRRAAEKGRAALWVHTHPGGDPTASTHDAQVDEELRALFADRTGSGVYGSVVVSPAQNLMGFAVTGHWWPDNDKAPARVARVMAVGERLALNAAYDQDTAQEDEADVFDRQVRAFGGPVQAMLGRLRVGVVGVGGTGSAVVEQLVRLGVRNLVLVDPDRLSISNVTRVYGSDPTQVGQLKVDVASANAQRIASDATIKAVAEAVTAEAVARALTGCDVLFGCTDDNAGRVVLSRLAAYYCIPLIDMGVLLDSAEGVLRGIYGRVTTWVPGHGCLLCRNRIDLARAAAETLPDVELQARQRDGYAPELGAVEPAVVTFTSLTAALAVNELLDRLIGYGPDSMPGEVLARVQDREIGSNTVRPRPGHFCDPASVAFGVGDTQPFLGVTWTR